MGVSVQYDDPGGRRTRIPAARNDGVSGLKALSRFVETAVPAFLLLALISSEGNNESVPDLQRLASMLTEWQDGDGAAPSASSINRLFTAVTSMKTRNPIEWS